MRQKITVLIAALAVVATACIGGETETDPVPAIDVEPTSAYEIPFSEEIEFYELETPNGEAITCAIYDGVRSGGIDCDWESTSE